MTRSSRWLASLLAATLAVAACGGDTAAPPETLLIETTELPEARVGVPYTEGVSATGGREDYTWEVLGGSLPPGLAISYEDLPDGDDILITGTPETLGSYSFTLRVTSEDGQTDTQLFAIHVRPLEALAVANVILPPALRGGPYDVPLRATGGRTANYSWTITSGSLPPGLSLTSGSIQGTPTVTDTVSLTVQVQTEDETASATFTLRVVADQPSTYNITTAAVAPIPNDLLPHVQAALAQWEDVITADLVAIAISSTFFSASGCAGFGQDVNGTTIDDLLVLINITDIDGPGDVLAQAGPCAIRQNGLPVAGILTLDSGDLDAYAGTNTATHIIAHELGHVLGFGSLWEELVTGRGGSNPTFSGAAAVAEWHALGGEGEVPVETEGGQGTAGSHWRESVFDEELMTGFSEQAGIFQPLSRVTIGSLADLGYTVDYGAADSFSLSLLLRAPGALTADLGRDIVLDAPPLVVDEGSAPFIIPNDPGADR